MLNPLKRSVTAINFEGQKKLSTDVVYDPEPFPYRTKKYGLIQRMYDYTTSRLNENSRIICVEGPPFVGKTEFAKHLSKEFDLHYMPPITQEELFCNARGFDMRKLNEIFEGQYPQNILHDLNDFYNEPDPKQMMRFGRTQIEYFLVKLVHYFEACNHLLATGQGVVMENSVWSDNVYTKLLHKKGYFTKPGMKYYNRLTQQALWDIWRPHLIVHLDAPTSTIMENMRKKEPSLANSPVFTESYVSDLQKIYKHDYLPMMFEHSEVLSYDITDMPDIDLVMLDLEKMDLIALVNDSEKRFKDWRQKKEEDYSEFRARLNVHDVLDARLNTPEPVIDCPELVVDGPSAEFYNEIIRRMPEFHYPEEFLYNPDGTEKQTKEAQAIFSQSLLAPAQLA